MRIFCAVRHSTDPRFYHGGLWSGNFYPALRRLGHEVIESNVDLLPASQFMGEPGPYCHQKTAIRGEITTRILDEVTCIHRTRPISLFLSYFYNSHFDPAGFDGLHRLGIPTINFYCNSIYQFDLVAAVAQKARFSWHAEKDARSSYLKVSGNPVWVQMGADPAAYYPVSGSTRNASVCFVGQRYADRDRLVAALIHASIPVSIYGSGWRSPNPSSVSSFESGSRLYNRATAYACVVRQNVRSNGFVGGLARTKRQWQYRQQTIRLNGLIATVAKGYADRIPETFASHELILNFSNVWADGRPGSALIPHVRLRDFEGPMCRTCFLTGHTKEIEEFYRVGAEIDTYRTAEELVDKARFYLTHPREAERMREAGYERAIRDHTWDQRFKELFQKIGMAN